MGDGTTDTQGRKTTFSIPNDWMSIEPLALDATPKRNAEIVRECCRRSTAILDQLKTSSPTMSARRTKKVIRQILNCESFRVGIYRRALRQHRREIRTDSGAAAHGYSLERILIDGRSIDAFAPASCDIFVGRKMAGTKEREYFAYSVAEYTRHRMLAEVWRAVSPCPPRQFGNSGGEASLTKFLETHLGGVVQVATTDFHACFYSLVHDQVMNGCPLPAGAMQRRLFEPLKAGETGTAGPAHEPNETGGAVGDGGASKVLAQKGAFRKTHGRKKANGSLLSLSAWASQPGEAGAWAFGKGVGVPLGSPLSVLAAEKVLDRIVTRFEELVPGALCALWADNLAILFQTETSEEQVKSALADAARDAIGDQFHDELLKRLSLGSAEQPFEFCNRRYCWRKGRLTITSRSCHWDKLATKFLADGSEYRDLYEKRQIINIVASHADTYKNRSDLRQALETSFDLGASFGSSIETEAQAVTTVSWEDIRSDPSKVRIYIGTDCRTEDSPGASVAIVSKDGGVQRCLKWSPFTSQARMELVALATALETLPDDTYIAVVSTSKYLSAELPNLPHWHAHGFRAASGKRLAYRTAWQRVYDAMQNKQICVVHIEKQRAPRKLREAVRLAKALNTLKS